ncbi:MAG: hypothetical protein KDD47_28035, partial [Acidobacteria bacterium]|nr:hypothetical protein [Acidobacteriota bacterium]
MRLRSGRSSSPRAAATWALALFTLSMAAAAVEQRSVRFERISLDLGLSQAFVTCSLQDTEGFMWFGTQ